MNVKKRRECVDHPPLRAARCLKCWAMGRKVSGLCVQHGRQTDQCVECLPVEVLISKNRFCNVCAVTMVKDRDICVGCDTMLKMRVERQFMTDLESLLTHPCSGNVVLGGVTCDLKWRRPDAIWIGHESCVVLEIDERCHSLGYNSNCEVQRLQEIHYALQQLKGPHYVVNCLHVGVKPQKGSNGVPYSAELVSKCADVLNSWFAQAPQTNPLAPGVAYLNYPVRHKHVAFTRNHETAVIFMGNL